MSDNDLEPMLDIDKVRELVRRGYDILETHGEEKDEVLSYWIPSTFHFYINRYGLTVVFKMKYLYTCRSNEIHAENLHLYDDALAELRQLMVLDDVANA